MQLKGPSSSTGGGGTWLMMASNNGCMSPLRAVGSRGRVALQRGRVDHGKIELFVARAEPVEEIERLIEHPLRAGAFTIDLVDHHERREAVLERLARDETRLRHRAVHCVDEQ